MKTIRKTIVLALATGISTYSFSQLNLGVSSTTQAAVKATANTTAITKATNAATQATSSGLKTTSATALDAKAKAATIVEAKTTTAASTVMEARENVLTNTNASTRAGLAASSHNNNSAAVGNTNAQAALGGAAGLSAAVDVNGQTAVDKTGTVTNRIAGQLENKTDVTVQTAKDLKTGTRAEAGSKVKTTREAGASIQPSANAEVKSDTKAAGAATIRQ